LYGKTHQGRTMFKRDLTMAIAVAKGSNPRPVYTQDQGKGAHGDADTDEKPRLWEPTRRLID